MYLKKRLNNLVEVENMAENLKKLRFSFLEGKLKKSTEPFIKIVDAINKVVVGVQIMVDLSSEIGISYAVQNIYG